MQTIFREYLVQTYHFQTRNKSLEEVEFPHWIYDFVVQVRTEGKSPQLLQFYKYWFFFLLYYTIPYFLATKSKISNKIKWHNLKII